MNETNLPMNPITQTRPRGIVRRWWVWLLLIALAGAGIYFFFFATGKAQQAATPEAGRPAGGRRGGPPSRVVAVPAKTGDINVFLNGLGSVTPQNSVTVKTRVDGQLMKILFQEGQVVKRGDLLAEIDPRAFQVQLTQAEGQMARDQALLKNAQLDLERYRMLFKQDSIAKQQLDTQESLVRQYEGATKVDRGQIESAQLQLSYARITAPIGGRLGLRQVDAGNMVRASDANGLVTITQLQPITVLFSIPEDNIPAVMKKLQAGETLAVDVYDRAQKAKLGSGALLTVDNQIDSTTGTVKLKAQFKNEDASLFPNQFVNTRMLVDVKRGVTVVPAAGIQRGSQGTFVYVVKEGSVSLRPVKIGTTQGDDTEVESGIAPGELVVVDGADKLREGAKVELATKDNGTARPRDGSARPRDGTGRRDGERRRRDGDAPPKDGAAPADASAPTRSGA